MIYKSPIITGLVIGLSADIVKLVVNYIAYSQGFTDAVFWQLVATNVLPKEFLHSTSAIIIGAVSDITVSGFLGIVFLYYIMYTGNDFPFIKGIGFSMLVWVGLFGTILGPSIEAKLPQNPAGVLVTIAAHFAFGISLAVFTSFLYNPKD